ncbi:MAG TPA: hypothetical protein VFM18_20425 [Methanosarcina sp.]|nr:hypothetical protein [Methanosarcina sp.]
MLTPKYAALSIQEQREFVGALVHLCQTNERCFDTALQILAWAQKNGHLERVKILPADWSEVPDGSPEAP